MSSSFKTPSLPFNPFLTPSEIPPPEATLIPSEPSTDTKGGPPTAVPRGDPPLASEIALGPDGKYIVADRGDGCVYVETFRGIETLSSREGKLRITLSPRHVTPQSCGADFGWFYYPETGEVILVFYAASTQQELPEADTKGGPPVTVPRRDPPLASEIALGPDGKYVVADRGDGCVYVEVRRMTVAVGTRQGKVEVILATSSPACQPEIYWVYYPETGEVLGGITN